MKKKIQVLIVGRPNTGKSSLINRILRQKKVITHAKAGITRDISIHPAVFKHKHFELVDSGGVYFSKTKDIYLQKEIEEKVIEYIHKVSKIIFLTDAKTGLHPLDENIARQLRPVKEKVIMVTNKVDDPKQELDLNEFTKLGFGQPYPLSVLQGKGIQQILEECTEYISISDNKEDKPVKIALIGKPNAGKSSLINAMFNEEKVIVNEKAGTTRDRIDIPFRRNNNTYIIMDTAGLRRRKKIEDEIEFYSGVRSQRAIDESDIIIIVLDSDNFFSKQDKQLINSVITKYKGVILFINKWDLTDQTKTQEKDIKRIIESEYPKLKDVVTIFGSAKEKTNIQKLFPQIDNLMKGLSFRIPTSQLNKLIKDMERRFPPPSKQGKSLKVYYATQPETNPVHIVFFVNHLKIISKNYETFLEKKLKEYIPALQEIPIKLSFKSHRDESRVYIKKEFNKRKK